MTDTELAAAIRKGTLSGAYLLCGEENYLKRHYLGEMRRAILTDPAFDAFNHTVLEGAKIDCPALLAALEAPPMMADKKLVEWHLADFTRIQAKESKNAKGTKEAKGETASEGELSRILALCDTARENPGTVLVFVVDADRIDIGTPPRRPSALYTALSAHMEIVSFDKATDAKLGTWILRHLAAEGLKAEPSVAAALLARCGHGMDALDNEILKLSAYLHAAGRTEVGAQDVEEITCANTEEDAFGLANAVIEGNAALAYENLRDMKLRKLDATVALASVTRSLSEMYTVAALAEEGLGNEDIAARTKLHPYRVGLYVRAAKRQGTARLRRALALARETDSAAKSMALDPYLLLEFLLSEILAKKQ